MPTITTEENVEAIKLQREESKRHQRDIGCIAITLSGLGGAVSGLLGLISGIATPFIISSSVSGAVGLLGTACCINGHRNIETQDATSVQSQASPTGRNPSFSNREIIRVEVRANPVPSLMR